MNDRELDDLLRSSRVPEPAADYWREFPVEVTRRLERAIPGASEPAPRRFALPVWQMGLAVTAVGFVLCSVLWYAKPPSPSARELAAMRTCLREIEALFPHQVSAIVFEPTGPRLVISERADVPDSTPIYLELCAGKTCQRIITFSGQNVAVNGETLEVLANPHGEIIVAGSKLAWSSVQARPASPPYRIQARTLEESS